MKVDNNNIPAELAEQLRKGLFQLHYRDRFRVHTICFAAPSKLEAIAKAQNWCKGRGYRFISVHPFLVDMDAKPKTETEVSDATA